MSIDTNNLRALAQAAPAEHEAVELHIADCQRRDAFATLASIAHRANDSELAAKNQMLSLLDELDKLRALLDTPWVEDDFGDEPRPTPIRGYVDVLVAGEDFRITISHAIALGAALIRAAGKP
jgi:hypothetical protein